MASFAVPIVLATLALSDLTPVAPGPGETFLAGSNCTLKWDADASGSWTNVTIDLMSGTNDNMTLVTPVAFALDGTNASLSPFSWMCPEVDPFSDIYFYRFTNGDDLMGSKWTTRFTIASPSNSSLPPEQSRQPNGDPIPWGNGALVSFQNSSSPSSKFYDGNATPIGNETSNFTQTRSLQASDSSATGIPSSHSGRNSTTGDKQNSQPSEPSVGASNSDGTEDSDDAQSQSDQPIQNVKTDKDKSPDDSSSAGSADDGNDSGDKDTTKTWHHDHSTEAWRAQSSDGPVDSGSNKESDSNKDSDSNTGSQDDGNSTMSSLFMTSSRMKKMQATRTASPSSAVSPVDQGSASSSGTLAPTVGLPTRQAKVAQTASASASAPAGSAMPCLDSSSNTEGMNGVKLANSVGPRSCASAGPVCVYALALVALAL